MKEKVFAGALVASALAISVAASGGSAVAAPGNPGVPSAPTVVLQEGFENSLENGQLVSLTDYVGTDGKTYTADPAWLDQANCNGILVDNQTVDATFNGVGCNTEQARDALRDLALKLGQLNGSADPTQNHVVAAYTRAGNPGANLVEFRTAESVTLPANGRFLSISLNVGVLSCHAARPSFNFFLSDSGEETKINDTALDPCRSTNPLQVDTVSVTPDNAALFSSNQVDVIIRNAQGSGEGNDHAFDDFKVLDVTPQLDKEFRTDDGDLRPGDVVDMVFTVTNTTELAQKAGWEFTDQLPSGLRVTGPGTTDCGGTLSGDAGATEVGISSGVLAADQSSCTISWPVTSTRLGSFVNLASDVDANGLNAPANAPVRFVAPEAPVVPAEPQVPATGVEAAGTSPATLVTLGAGMVLVLGAGAGLVLARRRG